MCGTQGYHEELRAAIVDLMCRNHEAFTAYGGQDLGQYLSGNTLQPRSWRSDVEVIAAATLLQTTVVVYTACTQTSRAWLPYQPLFQLPGASMCQEKVYL